MAQTVRPLLANFRAVARPIPVEVPVIKAVNISHSLSCEMHFGFGSADFRMLDLNIGSLVAAPVVTRITEFEDGGEGTMSCR